MRYFPSQFVTCPRCEGSGRDTVKKNTVCSHCYGLASGTFWHGEFLYWGGDLRTAPVTVRRAQHWLRKAFIIVLAGIAIIGAGSLFAWLFASAVQGNGIRAGVLFSFWGAHSIPLLLFWLGMLAALYGWYQVHRLRGRRPPLPFTCALPPSHSIPNNWQELRRYNRRRDVSRHYDEKTLRIIEDAALTAQTAQELALSIPRLMITLLEHATSTQRAQELWKKMEIEPQTVIDACEKRLAETGLPEQAMTLELRQLLIEAYVVASAHQRVRIDDIAVWQPLGYFATSLKPLLTQWRITPIAWYRLLAWHERKEKVARLRQRRRVRIDKQWHRSLQASNATLATPLLERYTKNITIEAREADSFWYYDTAALTTLHEAINPKEPRVLYLTGQKGSGKTAALHALAKHWAHDPCITHPYRNLALVNIEEIARQQAVAPVDALAAIAEDAYLTRTTVLAIDDIPQEWLAAIDSYDSWPVPLIITGTAIAGERAVANLDAMESHDLYGVASACAARLEALHGVAVSYFAMMVAGYAALHTNQGKAPAGRVAAILEQAAQRTKKFNQGTVRPELVAKIAATGTDTTYTQLLRKAGYTTS